MVIVIFGHVGSGKSTIAKELGKRLDAEVLNSDVVRKQLAGIEPTQRASDDFEKGIYTKEFTERVYSYLVDEALRLATSGKTVIVDATFRSERHRRMLEEACFKASIPVRFFYIDVPEYIIKQRLEEREKRGDVSDANWDVYLRMRDAFDPPVGAVRIDGNREVQEIVDEIIELLEGG